MSARRVSVEPSRVAERLRWTASLTRSGESASDIAIRLGVTQRSVERYRSRLHATRPQK
jgi:DNA-binding NarL/FixJ family response regulator